MLSTFTICAFPIELTPYGAKEAGQWRTQPSGLCHKGDWETGNGFLLPWHAAFLSLIHKSPLLSFHRTDFYIPEMPNFFRFPMQSTFSLTPSPAHAHDLGNLACVTDPSFMTQLSCHSSMQYPQYTHTPSSLPVLFYTPIMAYSPLY